MGEAAVPPTLKEYTAKNDLDELGGASTWRAPSLKGFIPTLHTYNYWDPQYSRGGGGGSTPGERAATCP